MEHNWLDTESFTKEAQKLIRLAVSLAGSMGHTYVGTEHLLLAAGSLDRSAASAVLIRFGLLPNMIEKEIVKAIGKGTPCRVGIADMTVNARSVTEGAVRTAKICGDNKTGTEYLLAAMASNRYCSAYRIIQASGVKPEQLCRECTSCKFPPAGASQSAVKLKALEKFGRELTKQRTCAEFDPVLCRESETQRIMEILCRRTKNNPCLVGEAGVGKTAVVEGLAAVAERCVEEASGACGVHASARQRRCNVKRLRPAHAHHGHAAASGRGGHRCNRRRLVHAGRPVSRAPPP